MVYYSALHYAAKAAKSAEAAADSATQASESSGKIIQVGFDGTLADGVLTFKHAPGGVETPYNLQDDFEYELDLAFASTADLPTNTQMVIKNGNDTIRFVSALHRDAATNATVADMDAVMRYNSDTGYRWLFKAAYKVTPSGDKVFLLYPVVAKEDTSKITNCITEIPQDIKLELNSNSKVIAKAGTKYYIPNGAGKFDVYTVPSDLIFNFPSNQTGTYFLSISSSGNAGWATVSAAASGKSTEATTSFYYRTDENKIRFRNNASAAALYSFPLAIVDVVNGAGTIKQIFNGFGYIGSTIFALPGVKGLIPNGRNADGSLKNIEFTTSKVLTMTYPIDGAYKHVISSFYNAVVAKTNYYYDIENNYHYRVSDNLRLQYVTAGDVIHESGRITSFQPKLPFRAADYQDVMLKQDKATAVNYDNITNCITEIPQDIKLELNSGTLTLKAGSKVYVPNGAGVFDEVVIRADITIGDITVSGDYFLFTNMGGTSIAFRPVSSCYSGTSDSGTKGTNYYNTSTNIITSHNSGGDSQITFPFARVTFVAGTGITSIDQVFNGFGYIGSTIFMLDGTKGLAPNGRNADGSLKNTEVVCKGVSVHSSTSVGDYLVHIKPNAGARFAAKVHHFEQNEKPTVSATYATWYSPDENLFRLTNDKGVTWTDTIGFVNCITITTTTNGRITSFTPKLPFRAVDQNDFNKLDEEVVKTSGNQTIGGSKTFTSGPTVTTGEMYFRTTNDASVTPSQAVNYGQINIYDKNSQLVGGFSHYHYASGNRETLMRCRNLNGTIYQISINAEGKTQAPTPVASSNTTEIATTAWVTSNGTKNSFKPNWAGKVSVAVATDYTAPSNGFISYRCSVWNRTPKLTINSVDIFSSNGNVIAGFFGSVPVCKGDIINLSGDNEAVIYFVPFK